MHTKKHHSPVLRVYTNPGATPSKPGQDRPVQLSLILVSDSGTFKRPQLDRQLIDRL